MYEIKCPIDAHLHLRQGDELKEITQYSECNEYSVLMPNTIPAIIDLKSLENYKQQVSTVCKKQIPLYTLKLTPWTKNIEQLVGKIIGIKLYPIGATTNSDQGVNLGGIEGHFGQFEEMEEFGIPLMGHWEDPLVPSMDREIACLDIIDKIIRHFPKLKIVFEHVSCRQSVDYIKENPQMRGSITLHHLLCTYDDLLGNHLQPHMFCKPIIKSERDREALLDVALSAHPKFFYGSDSAYHPWERKLKGAAGVFSAPVALSLLFELFYKNNLLFKLEDFISENASQFYNLTPTGRRIKLIQEKWKVPEMISGTVPLYAGQTISWRTMND